MISAEYYHSFFLLIVSLCSFFCGYKFYTTETEIHESKVPGWIMTFFLVMFIGYRPIHEVFADTVGYAMYHDMNLNQPFEFSWDRENYIFSNIDLWLSSINYDHTYLFLLMAACYFGIRYFSCIKLFPNESWIAYLFFLGSFITFTSSVNGLKAGVASSFFALAVAYRQHWFKAAICLAIAWGFHHAFHVCLLAYLVAYFYKNTKVYIGFWILALLLAIFHITSFQSLFADFTDERGAEYLSLGNGGWRTGMRYDFVIYGVVPIIVGYITCYKNSFKDKVYTFILNIYILLNGIWLLCMYASFTNRIAALSWLLYPIVISYPFLSRSYKLPQFNKNQLTAYALLLNVGFTIFMDLIYYGLLKSS